MQTIRSVTDAALISEIKSLAREERRITHEVLLRIQEVEARKLHLELGYPSIVEWLVKDVGYSESSAYRRMQAARLLKSVTEAGEKLRAGEVTLTALAKIQSVVKQEEKRTQTKVDASLKAELIQHVEAKSMRETEKLLFKAFPESSIQANESLRTVSGSETRLSVTFDDEQTEDLKRAKELLSHINPNMTWAEVIAELSKEFLKRKDPLRKPVITEENTQRASAAVPEPDLRPFKTQQTKGDSSTTYQSEVSPQRLSVQAELKPLGQDFQQRASSRQPIPAQVRRYILQRDQGKCQYRGKLNHQVCGSQFQIEIDHVIPVARGGSNSVDNLRCLCRKHNQLRAEQEFGKVQRH